MAPNVCWVSSETRRSASPPKATAAIGEIAPVAVASVVQPGRMIQDEADAFERDQAVGELVLDRLEFSDRLPELVTLLGVVHGQLERPPGRAMCPRQQCDLGLEAEIVEIGRLQAEEASAVPNSAEPRRDPRRPWRASARDRCREHPVGRAQAAIHRRPPEDVWHRPPRRSEARPLPCRPSMRIEPAPAIRIAGAEGESGHRRAGMQLFQQVHRGVGL